MKLQQFYVDVLNVPTCISLLAYSYPRDYGVSNGNYNDEDGIFSLCGAMSTVSKQDLETGCILTYKN